MRDPIKADDEVLESPFETAYSGDFQTLFYEECPAPRIDDIDELTGDPFCLVDRGIYGYLSGDEWTERLYVTNSYTIDEHLFGDTTCPYELLIDSGVETAAIRSRADNTGIATMDLYGATWRELIAWCRFVWRLHGEANAG